MSDLDSIPEGAHGAIVPRKETRTVYIGAGNAEYRSQSEAIVSLVRERLSGLLDELRPGYDFDTDAAADLLIKRRADVTRWLRAVEAAEAAQ